MAKEETKHLEKRQLENVVKLLKSANGVEEKIIGLRQKAGEIYENVILIFKEAGIPWGQMTREIQTSIGDWPKDEKGAFVGYQALLSDRDENGNVKYQPAIWLNRFLAYRNKYTNYDSLRKAPARPPRIADLPPEQRADARIKESAKETAKRISTAHAVNFDLVLQALRELYTFARATGNKAAEAPILAVAKAFGINQDAVFELNMIVLPKEGQAIVPQKLQEEPAEQASVH